MKKGVVIFVLGIVGLFMMTCGTDRKGEASIIVNGVEFIFVKGGTFEMGDRKEDGYEEERPVHTVTLSDYYISKHEITFHQYDVFCDSTARDKPYDNNWGRGDRPVINVSYYDAKSFCDWMSRTTGRAIRLPTEAEWEYAARGGDQSQGFLYSGSNDVDSVAWHTNNSGWKTHPVGTKKANELGLYDMSGNVWEWCWDLYDAHYYGVSPEFNPKGPAHRIDRWDYRVIRGGCWYDDKRQVRCAFRGDGSLANEEGNDYGFRCAMDP